MLCKHTCEFILFKDPKNGFCIITRVNLNKKKKTNVSNNNKNVIINANINAFIS